MIPKKKLLLYGNEPKSIEDLVTGKLSSADLKKARNDIEKEVMNAYSNFVLEDRVIDFAQNPKVLELMLKYCFVPLSFEEGSKSPDVGVCTDLYNESDDPGNDTMYGRAGIRQDGRQLLNTWLEDISEYTRLAGVPSLLNLKKTSSEENPNSLTNPKVLARDDYAFALFYNFGIGNKADFIHRFKLIVGEDGASRKIVLESLDEAVRRAASDIHVVPYDEKTAKIRLRVDGSLYDIMEYRLEQQKSVIGFIKGLAGQGMDSADDRRPQDGHFTHPNNPEIQIRAATSRTINGQLAVLRLLYGNSKINSLEDLGFSQDTLRKYKAILQNPNGLIVFTGPTGCGKSTSLATSLNELVKTTDGKKNILTVENPVETTVVGANQHEVNYKISVDFAKLLKAFLREDPDIIMVGEVRDAETAQIAVQAAQTGHLVLTTLHSNDAVQGINRLQTWGLDNYLVADTLRGIMSQKLGRRICSTCSDFRLNGEDLANIHSDKYFESSRGKEFASYYMTPHEKRRTLRKIILGSDAQEKIESLLALPFKKTVPRELSEKCKNCFGAGYKGRVAFSELLVVDDKIRGSIIAGSKEDEIAKYDLALKRGMVPMIVDSLLKAADGITTVKEALSNVGGMDVIKYQEAIRMYLGKHLGSLKA